MHNGSFDPKNDHPQSQPNGTTTVSDSGGFKKGVIITQATIASKLAAQELSNIKRDVFNLLQTELPKILELTEVLTRHASALFPFAQGDDMLAQAVSAITQSMTFGINPTVALLGVHQAAGASAAIVDSGATLKGALRSAGGPAFDPLKACEGLYSLYKTYAELNRLYASAKFCTERLKTNAQEILAVTGAGEAYKKAYQEVAQEISQWWDTPGSMLDYFTIPAKILEELKAGIDMYESAEPLRMAIYFAMIAPPAELNAGSQLDQVTHLLTNACYNTLLDNVGNIAKNVGNTVGSTLPTFGINKLKKLGTKAALTASVTAIAGMSCPITVAILATCASNQKTRQAFIDYAKYLMTPSAGEIKLDDSVHRMVSQALCSLEQDEENSLLGQFKPKISSEIKDAMEKFASQMDAACTTVSAAAMEMGSPVREKFNSVKASVIEKCTPAMERCASVSQAVMKKSSSVSGSITGAIFEQTMRTLLNDSTFAGALRGQLDKVIYQILEGTLRQTLQIQDQKIYLERMENNQGNANEAAVYQACGAIIPSLANLLALPELVEHQLQTTTGKPGICRISETSLNLQEKMIQTTTRLLQHNVEGNIAAALLIGKGSLILVNKGLDLKKAIMGTAPENATNFTLLGSKANRKSKGYDYAKQAELQERALARSREREKAEKQAAELQKIEDLMKKHKFEKAYFEGIPGIKTRVAALLEELDSWNFKEGAPASVAEHNSAVTHIREYISRRSNELNGHMAAAKALVKSLELDKKPTIGAKLLAISNAVNNASSSMAPEAKTHYLALLRDERDLIDIPGLAAPLKALYKASTEEDYVTAQTLIETYLATNPSNAGLILADVAHFQTTFWFYQSYPAGLLKLEEFLNNFAQGKPAENAASVAIHLPQDVLPPVREEHKVAFEALEQPVVRQEPSVDERQSQAAAQDQRAKRNALVDKPRAPEVKENEEAEGVNLVTVVKNEEAQPSSEAALQNPNNVLSIETPKQQSYAAGIAAGLPKDLLGEPVSEDAMLEMICEGATAEGVQAALARLNVKHFSPSDLNAIQFSQLILLRDHFGDLKMGKPEQAVFKPILNTMISIKMRLEREAEEAAAQAAAKAAAQLEFAYHDFDAAPNLIKRLARIQAYIDCSAFNLPSRQKTAYDQLLADKHAATKEEIRTTQTPQTSQQANQNSYSHIAPAKREACRLGAASKAAS